MITREEALNKYRCYSSEWNEFSFEGFLNYIYDDFEQQLKEAKSTIEALQEPKSCDGCKYREDYAGTFTCFHLDNIVDTSPQEPYGIYIQDANTLRCIHYEPKDKQ